MTKHLLPLASFLVACGADVPDKPTYFADVQPILLANCVRCHGADPVDPKIATFRLDRYVKNDDDPVLLATSWAPWGYKFDAYDYAQGDPSAILRVAVNHEAPAMPPDYSLTDRQRDILARWILQGAPRGTRATNHAPRIELVSPSGATTADQNLDTTFRAWDDDLDGLYVQLWARDLTASGEPPYNMMSRATGGGLRSVVLDTGTLASTHTFEIYAELDDGYNDNPNDNRTTVTLIPELVVDHGVRGTAPRVALTAPNGGETLIGTATITWTASDPDPGDSLVFSLDLMRVASDGTTSLVQSILPPTGDLPVPPAGQPYSVDWDVPTTLMATDGNGAPIPYKIQVTAQDTAGIALGVDPNVRSDESDLPVYVAQAVTTTYKWADVRPIFEMYCKDCHSAAGKTPAIDYFCMLKYNTADPDAACESSDQGVFDVKGQVYQRLVVAKTMPPATEPKPPQADLDKVGNWILGGAPPGGTGPTDAPPTLTWLAPDDVTVLDASTTLVAPLMWEVADAELLMSDSVQYVKLSGVTDCNAASCPPTTMVVWKTLTGAGGSLSSTGPTARSFSWNAPVLPGPMMQPDRGCYCVRGTVTDSAGQAVPVTAQKSVKF